MNTFKKYTVNLLVLALMLLVFGSCDNTSEPDNGGETALTQEQAETYFQQNAGLFAELTSFLVSDMVDGAEGDVNNFYSLGGISTYGNSGFLKGQQISALLKNGLSDTLYYKGDGCWYLEIIESLSYISSDIKGDICFGTVDEMGYPLETNNLFDFMLDGLVTIDYSDESYTQFSSFDVLKDFNMTGIQGFSNGTGMITTNGSQSEEVVINLASEEGSFNSTLKINYTVSELKVDAQNDYPAGGGFQFQLSIKMTETGQAPVELLINGSVTFDGTELADVEFNGYDFVLDLSESYYY